MINKANPLTLAICTAMACAPVAHGAVTYIDATMANTNNAAGGLDSTWLDGNDGTTGGTVSDGAAANDGRWRFRGGFGSAGIFEATGSTTTAENAVMIVTSISGLADGTYNIYAFFRASSSTGENYNIKASLSPTVGDSDIFRQNDTRGLTLGTLGLDSSSSSFTFASGAAPVPNPGDTRALLYGMIGQAVVSGGDSVNIYIDDLPALGYVGAGAGGGAGSESTVRTWYDGVGYELIPEPSTALLTGLGALALLRRRRVG